MNASKVSFRNMATVSAGIASAVAAAIMASMLGLKQGMLFFPVLALLPVAVYLGLRGKKEFNRPEQLMNEAPAAIGMMSIVLSSNGSFDGAVREVANHGPTGIARLFKAVVMDADCRELPDIESGIKALVSRMPQGLAPLRRALLISITAFASSDAVGRKAMMKDAESIVLAGLKQMGESYSSKLNTPCMLIFGLGIMVPMMLVSVLPMLSISGQFGVGSSISSDAVAFLTVVCIPAALAVIIASLRGRNPFFKVSPDGIRDLKYLGLLAIAPAVYFAAVRYGLSAERSVIASASVPCLIALALMVPRMVSETRRIKAETMLKDAMFDMGNRLSMGENYGTALERALSARTDCRWLAEAMSRELAICRGDVGSAVMVVLSKVSPAIAALYCDVYSASLKDTRDAGRLASGIAHQLQDQDGVRKSIENKLKSMLDMMTGTSAVFAPLILGMSVVMLGPLGRISGVLVLENIGFVLIAYLIELAALISVLSSSLMCKGGMLDMECRFCAMMPISLVIFTVCSSIAL